MWDFVHHQLAEELQNGPLEEDERELLLLLSTPHLKVPTVSTSAQTLFDRLLHNSPDTS